ncbi:EscU/YscU/HrcU family type III secretion system export apparatus switch protein [Arsenophonus sp. aPb]|uniref:EscU/YscU/HrcU family type III secretion system export apparatus switch protein n=1 Tax=Arsenophonus sp. aPb TaxID=3041619 RepID=UPI002469061D|nr:EscU/YscU/HrcU family type III secretion system export apparatus switch protein [Arsenophonus sp. aPb]WGL98618.1 EscU/YscU/HrcU family type III secretion system export apparatus switch protein [Arsenophonus sp. aPb]
MAEKTEKPTAKKLRDSAKKGQSFKSKDLVSGCAYFAGTCVLGFYLEFDQFIYFYQHILLNPHNINPQSFINALISLFLSIVLPVIFISALAAIIPSLIQSKFILATEAIKLDFKKLDIVQGIKRLVDKRALKNLFKALLFLAIFISSCYFFIQSYQSTLLFTQRKTIWHIIYDWRILTLKFVSFFLLFSLPILFLDALCEYFLHHSEMKMEKHEVKREYKENEGNPEIKSARRGAHQELLNAETKQAIAQSSMILANPTHIAIGIYFDPDNSILPLVAVRMANQYALAVQAYAKEIGIPIVRNVKLARQIYHRYRLYETVVKQDLLDVIDIFIWLKQVEMAAILENSPIETENSEQKP